MNKSNITFEAFEHVQSDSIAIITKGYCWQHIKLKEKSKVDHTMVCELYEVGNLIGLSKKFNMQYTDTFIAGLHGCSIRMLEPEELRNIDLQNFQQYKKFMMYSIQYYFRKNIRKINKTWTANEENIFSLCKIIDLGQPSELNNEETQFLTIKATNSNYGFQIPLPFRKYFSVPDETLNKLSDNNYLVDINDSMQNEYGSAILDVSEVSERIKVFFGSRFTYSTILNTISNGQSSSIITLTALKNALIILDINYEILELTKKTKSQEFLDFGQSSSSLYFYFDNNGLTNPITNISSNIGSSILKISPPVEGKISFVSFLKELAKNRSSVALILTISFVVQILTLSVPLLFQQIIDKVINQQNPTLLPILITVMISASLLGGIFRISRQLIVFDIADRADERFSEYVIRRLIGLKYKFFSGSKRGDLAGRIQEVSSVRAFFTGPALSTILDLVFAVVYLSILLLYSVKLTFTAFSPIPIYLGIVAWGAPFYKNIVKQKAHKRSMLISYLLEVISGIESVKLQGYGDKAINKWRDKFEDQQRVALSLTSLGSILGEVAGFCTQLSGILILAVGAGLVMNGDLTLGELIAFRIISGFLTTPLVRLSSLWQSVQDTSVSLDRVNNIVEYESEDFSNSIDLKSKILNISFSNVSFAYNNGINVVNDISFNVPQGAKVCLIGRSGSGKSTLIKLLTGLYQYDSGDITVANSSLELLNLKTLRSYIYCVPQESHFVGGTIEDNIRYGWNDCTNSQLENALDLSCYPEVISTKLGLNYPVNEGGANFSGGQKQRLALARMIIRKPKVIVLDEATSALDSITEKNVIENLIEFCPESSIIMITHRVKTSKMFDNVVLLKDGIIIAQGDFEKLSSSNQEFKEMLVSSGDS